MIARITIALVFVAGAFLSLIGRAEAAPFLLSEKMPEANDTETGHPMQPDAFYALAGDTRLACTATKVKSTGTVQMSCDLAPLTAGSYLLTVVAVKTSNGLETRKSMGTLKLSGAYSCQKYLELRVCNTAYSIVKP